MDQNGLRILPVAGIGQPSDLKGIFSDAKDWKIQGQNEEDKYARAMVVVDGNVFIGLGSDNGEAQDGHGGVVIFNKENKIILPAAGWNKKNVSGFAVNGNMVYAVTAEGLFDVSKADGTFASFAPAGEDNVKLLPKTGITSARFVKGNLVIATKDQGRIYRSHAEAK